MKQDGVYFKACVSFGPKAAGPGQQKLGILVTKPFCTWTKQSTIFQKHEQSQYYQDSMARMLAFEETATIPSKNISSILDRNQQERILHNKEVLKTLFKCVLFCGKQGLALRDHRDDNTVDDPTNKGNFLELVHFCATTDAGMRRHLENAPRNAMYTSKTIQNEMINIVGNAI